MSPEFLQAIKMLVLKNEMIEAKTRLFQHFGNLSEANAFLETLLPTNNITHPHEVLEFIKMGEIINAIKFVRDKNGWDLRTSKEYVDNLRQALGLL